MSRLVVGTAGHIDHGKSSLVLALTGIDPDRLQEEKARGITIELGFAHTTIDDVNVAFVDVPGHEKFVRTMLAGVGGVDFVMLIVAADESVMPQTREHFDICRLLGVRAGCVVLTKSDLVDDDTQAIVRMEVVDLVAGSFLDGAPVLAVSARTGAGLTELREVLRAAAHGVQRRPVDAIARLPIDRAFTMRGFGTVVTGTLLSGRIAVGEDLRLVPGDRVVRVRGLQTHGQAQDSATAGQRTAVNLGGVDLGDVARGQTLTSGEGVSVTRRVDVRVDLLPAARPLRHGARIRLHHGTNEALGRVSWAGGNRVALESGQSAVSRLRLETPMALTRGDRAILRVYSPPFTIGAATVIDPAPARPGIRTDAGLRRLEALANADDISALALMIAEAGVAGLPRDAAVSRVGLSPAEAATTIAALVTAGDVLAIDDRLVSRRAADAAGQDVVATLRAFHQAEPMHDGLPREDLRVRHFRRVTPAIFDTLMRRWAAATLLVDGDRVALPGHRATVPGGIDTVTQVAEAFRAAGLTVPDTATLATAVGIDLDSANAAIAYLLRQKTLVRLDTLVVHREALEQLKRDVKALKESVPPGTARLDVGQFKERYGITRKFAIPLLEYLDRERVTRRAGDTRVVL
ncbi:MAG: selenocysteine-specific translation elongation factor [Acidobacteria bacterium]|nr:selenocysteine-specific translation elongation factor [Acidobacteriota bacterium]